MAASAESLKAVQIGLNSSDLPGSLRLYNELGFRNAGGHMIWGGPMAIQGLPPSARGQLYWLVGRQERVQLEFFHLTNPAQRAQPEGWRACDLGWTRFGIAVPDLEAARQVLARWDIAVAGETALAGDAKRLAFRDPFIGCFVELIEDGDAVPGGMAERHHDADPSIVYATSSVSDLDAARAFYADTLGLDWVDDQPIHGPEHEALWQLDGAQSRSFVVKSGSVLLEIVEYLDPRGQPRRPDHTVADQGIMNVALCSPSLPPVEQALARVDALELERSETVMMGPGGGAYVLAPERELEICAIPPELEAGFGFVPTTPFFGEGS